jgi:hypothetical protein
MKIIAKVNSSKYLIEATDTEIARVLGVSSEYYLEREAPQGVRSLAVGTEIPVSPWWDFVHKLKGDEESVRKMGATLRSIADLVTGAWPGIVEPIEGEPPK